VASSLVKVISQLDGDVSAFVSPRVKARLQAKAAKA
jgi:phosphopantetheine adenylyltransferase